MIIDRNLLTFGCRMMNGKINKNKTKFVQYAKPTGELIIESINFNGNPYMIYKRNFVKMLHQTKNKTKDILKSSEAIICLLFLFINIWLSIGRLIFLGFCSKKGKKRSPLTDISLSVCLPRWLGLLKTRRGLVQNFKNRRSRDLFQTKIK